MDGISKGWRISLHLLSIPVTLALSIWATYVTSIIWNWFAVPILSAPRITTVAAFGLGCVFSSFTWAMPRRHDLRTLHKLPDDALARLGEAMFEHFVFPTALLGFAWIVKGFM